MERFATRGSISVWGMKGRFPQGHKLSLAVTLSAAFSPTYDRCPKQDSDTKHVLSKGETQKKLSSYHLFVTQAKRQRGRLRWLPFSFQGEGAEWTPALRAAPQAADGARRAPALSPCPLAATVVSVDFGKKSDNCGNLSLKFNILLSVTM